jgi:hypothetical protein
MRIGRFDGNDGNLDVIESQGSDFTARIEVAP